MSINRVTLSGNLTRDPEIRSTASGMNILNFGMAVNDRRRNNQTGAWEDYANFVDCVLFGNRADFLSRTLHKGIKVVVEGKLRYRSWESDGQRRSKLEVVVDDLDFITPRQQGNGGYAPQQGGYGNAQSSEDQHSYGQQQSSGSFNASAPAPAPAQPQSQNYGYREAAPQSSPAPQQSRPVTAPPQSDVYDDDIPF